MTPVLQQRKDGSGDCLRACIAGVLDLPIDQVPDFTGLENAMEPHETGYETWYLALQKWLAGKGYFFLEVQLSMKTWFPLPMEALAIFVGERETEAGICRHAIIGKCEGDAFYPLFDPLGGNPLQSMKDNKILGVCFLVPLDPTLQVKLGKAMDNTIRLARQLPFSEIKDALLANAEECFGITHFTLPFNRESIRSNGKR